MADTKHCSNPDCTQANPQPLSEFRNLRQGCHRCASCMSESRKRYYAANRDRLVEQSRKYRKENPQVVAERWRRYYAVHKDEFRERNRAYSAANREKCSAYGKAWREANPDRCQFLNYRKMYGPLGEPLRAIRNGRKPKDSQ